MSKVKEWFDGSVAAMQLPVEPPEPVYKKVTLRLEVPVCDKLDEVTLRLSQFSRTRCAEGLLVAAIDEAYSLVTSDEWLMSAEIHSMPMDEIEKLMQDREDAEKEAA